LKVSGSIRCISLNHITDKVLLRVDHQVPAEFAAFFAMRQEIRDANTHSQLQDDLVEHLWMLKGNNA
jgi:hypothetical protein